MHIFSIVCIDRLRLIHENKECSLSIQNAAKCLIMDIEKYNVFSEKYDTYDLTGNIYVQISNKIDNLNEEYISYFNH